MHRGLDQGALTKSIGIESKAVLSAHYKCFSRRGDSIGPVIAVELLGYQNIRPAQPFHLLVELAPFVPLSDARMPSSRYILK